MKGIVKGIVIILIMLLVIVIIAQNLNELSKTLSFRFGEHQTPPMAFWVLGIIVFLIGVFVTGFLGIFERFRLKREIKRLSKENKEKDKELNSYRNLPIVEENIEDTTAVVTTNNENALSNNNSTL